ncbi:hypothetical protein TB1_033143 [Malus domestica]
MTASLMHLLVHLRILNWIVVNSPRLWNKGLSRTYAEVGFEPTTSQLTADRSTTELLRNNRRFDLIEFNSRSQPMTNMSSKFPL